MKPNKSFTPGVGQYEYTQRIGNENAKYTIRSVRPNSAKDTFLFTPGPGEYSYVKKNTKRPQSYRFGRTDRFFDPVINEKKKVPGPQDYKPKVVCKTASNWGFGSEDRGYKVKDKMIVPGPGSYETSYFMGNGNKHKHAFTSRIDHTKFIDKTPGTGSYIERDKVDKTLLKAPTWRFGSGRKDDLYRHIEKKSVPGPGDYSIKTTFCGGTSTRFGIPYKETTKKAL